MHQERVWFRTVGSVASAVLFLVGAAGIPDDIGTWGKWLHWAHAEVPWWAMLLAGAVVFAITWIPVLIRRQSLALLWERILLATPFGAAARARRETLRLHVVNLGFPAAQHAINLLRNFTFEISRDGNPLHEWLAGLVQGHLFDNYDRQASLLLDPFRSKREGRNRIFYTEHEISSLFAEYWYRYQALAAGLMLAARIRPELIVNSQLYPFWSKADEEFVAALRRLVVQQGFDDVAAAVTRTGWGDEYRRLPTRDAA